MALCLPHGVVSFWHPGIPLVFSIWVWYLEAFFCHPDLQNGVPAAASLCSTDPWKSGSRRYDSSATLPQGHQNVLHKDWWLTRRCCRNHTWKTVIFDFFDSKLNKSSKAPIHKKITFHADLSSHWDAYLREPYDEQIRGPILRHGHSNPFDSHACSGYIVSWFTPVLLLCLLLSLVSETLVMARSCTDTILIFHFCNDDLFK